MTKQKKPKPKGYAPSLSEFMRNADWEEVFSTFTTLDDCVATLKYYLDKDYNSVIYKMPDNRGWRMAVFQCSREQMEQLYSNVAVSAVAQMLLRSTLWVGEGKPHFPVKNRSAIIFAWSKLGRQVQYHEMSAYPDAVAMIGELVNTSSLRVS